MYEPYRVQHDDSAIISAGEIPRLKIGESSSFYTVKILEHGIRLVKDPDRTIYDNFEAAMDLLARNLPKETDLRPQNQFLTDKDLSYSVISSSALSTNLA